MSQTSCDMYEGCQWVPGKAASTTTSRYISGTNFVYEGQNAGRCVPAGGCSYNGGLCGFEGQTNLSKTAATDLGTFVPKAVRLYKRPTFTRFSGCAARPATQDKCEAGNLCVLNSVPNSDEKRCESKE